MAIPVIYFFITQGAALTILIPLTVAFVAVDIIRYYHKPTEEWFYTTFGWLLRQRESDHVRKRLNGASHVLIGATICIFLFPKVIAITALSILIISDTASALLGRRFGKHRFLAKSLEGSIGFFLSALLVVIFVPKITHHPTEYMIGAAAALVGTIVEAVSIEIDDNLSIPLSVGVTIWVGYHYFLPMLNVYTFG